ncbi:MAG: hypothetical protein HMLKMBBP_03367 [Planctomycetes bacterium]|nr:hypothetical protein [Planctomycetota bacterium]
MSTVAGGTILWHYMPGRAFRPTFEEGLVRTSPDPELLRRQGVTVVPEGYYDAKPVAWFSAEPVWEPSTALRIRGKDGNPQYVLDMAENARLGGGLFRIGVAPETAPLTWTGYRKGGYDAPDVCNRMAKRAAQIGSDVRKWFASARPVPRAEWIAVETWIRPPDGRAPLWIPFPGG